MQKNEKNKLITESIHYATSIAIVPSKIGAVDAYAAGAGLYHILKKNEKNVKFIYPGKVPDGCEDLIPQEEITSNIKRRDLLIAVDYTGLEMEQVKYATEGSVFYLRMGPVPRDFDLKKVKAIIEGVKFDIFIVIGAQMLDDLGPTYHEMEKEFLTSKIINLDTTDRNTRFGHYNIVDPLKDSLSLLCMHAAMEWDFKIDSDAAQAFLIGISHRKI